MTNEQTPNTPVEERDLFDESAFSEDENGKIQSATTPKKKKKKKKSKGPYVIGVLCLILAVCLGILFFHFYSTGKNFSKLQAAEQQQYDTYVETITSTAMPAGWDQETFAALQQKAQDAYDLTLLNTINQAEAGDETAKDQLKDITEPSAQPVADQYTQLFSNLSAYPEEIASAFTSDPAMMSFILDYPNHASDAASDALLTESLDTIPDLKTFNPAWGYLPYGNGILATNGSAPVCISEVFAYLNDNPAITPGAIAQWAIEYGYDLEPVRETDDSIFGAASLTWGVNMTPVGAYPANISTSLSYGSPMIIGLQNGDTTVFEVITGIDENGNWIIQNPSSSAGPSAVVPDSLADQIVYAYAFW